MTFIVNLRTGDYMVADHYALVERGMPEGYETAHDISDEGWLDAIAVAAGNEPMAMAQAGGDERVIVRLSTGESCSLHLAIDPSDGVDTGWTSLEELGPLDMLDALRACRGLDPCDRSDFEVGSSTLAL